MRRNSGRAEWLTYALVEWRLPASCRAGWPAIVVILPLARSLSSPPKALASSPRLHPAAMAVGTSGVCRYFPSRCRRAAAGTPYAIHFHILVRRLEPHRRADLEQRGRALSPESGGFPCTPWRRRPRRGRQSGRLARSTRRYGPTNTAARSAIARRAIWPAVSPASGSFGLRGPGRGSRRPQLSRPAMQRRPPRGQRMRRRRRPHAGRPPGMLAPRDSSTRRDKAGQFTGTPRSGLEHVTRIGALLSTLADTAATMSSPGPRLGRSGPGDRTSPRPAAAKYRTELRPRPGSGLILRW